MSIGNLDVKKADGGLTAALLNVIAGLMVAAALVAILQRDGGGLGVAIGIYILIGALFLFAFASIVGNLSRIVWILKRSAIPANDARWTEDWSRDQG